MNPELQQLKDIHLPQAINTLPIALGWLFLYVLLAVMISYLCLTWYQRYLRRKSVKYALVKLQQLKELNHSNPENVNIAMEVSTLLRRTALRYFPRSQIAGLSGNEWLTFLNQSSATTPFSDETGRLLIDAPYRKNNTTDLDPLFNASQAWLVAIAKNNKLSAEK